MVVLTPIERETLQDSLYISQMLIVSTFGNTADIYAIVHLVPHACQHIRLTRATAAVKRLRKSGDQRGVKAKCPSQNLRRKVAQG